MVDDGLDQETRDPKSTSQVREAPRLTLTVLFHPDLQRVGERAFVDEPTKLSRLEPLFAFAGEPRPLADTFVSRSPITIVPRNGAATLTREGSASLSIDGVPMTDRTEVDTTKGAVLELGGRIVLLLHEVPPFRDAPNRLGMIGEDAQMHALRWELLRVARSDLPVLLRGETGTGKEHAARALHQFGLRPDGPFIAVNMGAIQPALAASTLFGHVKGAFTGADSDRVGLFERAHGGTLFLDEIGEAPVEVQVMLLRILETGTLERVGGTEERTVSVRLVTATDADLGRLVSEGKLRPALLHRLSGYELVLPPLRTRREDIGRLVAHFHQLEQTRIAELDPERTFATDGDWLPPAVIALLARQDWPGNVRQLANVVRRLLLIADSAPEVMMEQLTKWLAHEEPAPEEAEEVAIAPSPRRPQDVSEDEVFEAMQACGWRLEKAAERLGISRPSLYRLVEAHPKLRTAKDLTKDELVEAHRATGGELDRMSAMLRVSRAGIQQRLRQLEIE